MHLRGPTVRTATGLGTLVPYLFFVPYLVAWLHLGPELDLPAPPRWIGAALAVGGVAFAVWSMVTLGRHYDYMLEVHADHELVRTGPYAWVRHPVYTGLALHFAGGCLATGNLLLALGTLFGTLPAFVARARTEEGMLREQLGPQYDRYMDDVPMLVPGLRGRGVPERTRRKS